MSPRPAPPMTDPCPRRADSRPRNAMPIANGAGGWPHQRTLYAVDDQKPITKRRLLSLYSQTDQTERTP